MDGVFYFRPRSEPVHSTGIVPGRPFSVALPQALGTGKYALVVDVTWPGRSAGDATYGFTVTVP
jgi:hypothetical protein